MSKSIILYLRQKIAPETLEAIIAQAPHATLIPVEESEMDAFTVLTIEDPEPEPKRAAAPRSPRRRRG